METTGQEEWYDAGIDIDIFDGHAFVALRVDVQLRRASKISKILFGVVFGDMFTM